MFFRQINFRNRGSSLPTIVITYVKVWFWHKFQNYVTSEIASELGSGIRYCYYVRQSCGLLKCGINLQSHYVKQLRQCVL